MGFYGLICALKIRISLIINHINALDSKSSSFGSEGSIPSGGTKKKLDDFRWAFFGF